MSNRQTVRGPWNEGEMPDMGKDFEYIAGPITYVNETNGLTALPDDKSKELKSTEKLNKEMSKVKSEEVTKAEPEGIAQWSTYATDEK
ncbi:MAG: ydbD [Mucilaginibacter sp.]|nr:ydbD [Mucilaginibacter sp.]